jgi:transcriptional regulator with XRE-family HTH domain
MAKTTKAVGDLLRQMRTERGRSLRSAASDLGVDPSYLSKVERGQKPAPTDLQARAADYYDIDSDELSIADGQVPADIREILVSHPEALEELRRRYG